LENEEQTLPNITSTEKDLILCSFTNTSAFLFSTSDFSVRKCVLSSHSYIENWNSNDDEKGHLRHFLQNIALYDFKEAMKSARILDN